MYNDIEMSDAEFLQQMDKELRRRVDNGDLPQSALSRLHNADECEDIAPEDMEFAADLKLYRQRLVNEGRLR